jgi:hypothetical protein
VENAALCAMRQCGFEDELSALGLNRPQIAAAVAIVVARMAHPASELATHAWLQQHSGLGGLIGLTRTVPGLGCKESCLWPA